MNAFLRTTLLPLAAAGAAAAVFWGGNVIDRPDLAPGPEVSPRPLSGYAAPAEAPSPPARPGGEAATIPPGISPGWMFELEGEELERVMARLDSVIVRVPGHAGTADLLELAARERLSAVDSHLKLGISHFLDEDMESAIEVWDAVLELDPDNRLARDYRKRAEKVLKTFEEVKSGGGASAPPPSRRD